MGKREVAGNSYLGRVAEYGGGGSVSVVVDTLLRVVRVVGLRGTEAGREGEGVLDPWRMAVRDLKGDIVKVLWSCVRDRGLIFACFALMIAEEVGAG
jgi:hypothetical protein